MSKFTSFKRHQLITENWRRFLKEGISTTGTPEFDTLRDDLNALWVKLRDEGALQSMTTADFEAAGIDTEDLWAADELGGIRWSRTGEDEYTPDDPAEVAAIEAEEDAIDSTRTPSNPEGASAGEQIGLPGFEQE